MRDTNPMVLVNSRAAVDRIYAETGPFQWARETALNAIEAKATRIYFGLDWNGVEATGTYRRFIADNGCGMTADELVGFFRGLGATSKTIGGAHDNYGIGAKVSLLPWNTAGLLVASWKNGEGNVIWAKADDTTKEFGLRLVELDDEFVDVWPTTDDPDLGFDLEKLRPEWITDHGTVLLLLGDDLTQHTILNDPRHDPKGSRRLDDYLNRRFWTVPEGVAIQVDQLSGESPKQWPRQRTHRAQEGIQRRPVNGALAQIAASAPAHATIDLDDGSHIHWFLRAPDAPGTGRDSKAFIAALYRGELYEHRDHHVDYRNFGIGPKSVRSNLWLVIQPRLADADRLHGAFPEQDRNGLLWNDGADNKPLPWGDWGDAWINHMPDEVRDAISAQTNRGGEFQDATYKERLAALFGERWRIERQQYDADGTETVEATDSRRKRRRRPAPNPNPSPPTDGTADPTIGKDTGSRPASSVKPRGGLPDWYSRSGDEFDERWVLATFEPKPNPTVFINKDHPVIRDQIFYWVGKYPHDPSEVEDTILSVYGECAVACVAHSEQLKNQEVDRRTLDDKIRSDSSLTLALLGLWAQDSLISARLAGKLGRRRTEDAAVVEEA